MHDPFDHPPRLVFHLALVPLALLLLYAVSFPGFSFLALAVAGLALLLAASLWAARVVTYGLARRRGVAGGSAAWLLVAPLGGVLVAGLVAGAVPLRVRWAASRPAFERALRQAPPPTGGRVAFDVPGRVGSYPIAHAYRNGEAVIFVAGPACSVAGSRRSRAW